MAAKPLRRRALSADREVLYGFHPVVEALSAARRTIHSVMVDRTARSGRQTRVVELAEKHHIAWQTRSSDQISALCGSDRHQGIAASVSALSTDSLQTLVGPAGRSPGHRDDNRCLLVLLDSIVDPNNLGAIVRTAHCAGVDAVVFPKDRAAGATPAVSKASAGALEHTRLCRVTNLVASIQWLKKRSVWVAGLTMQADRTVFQADLKGPLALVVGGEEKGLRPLVRQHCDYLVSIPLLGRVDSLNASAAVAVALYEALRQRQAM